MCLRLNVLISIYGYLKILDILVIAFEMFVLYNCNNEVAVF